jgi:hypothetical protein
MNLDMNLDTLRFGELSPGEAPSASKRVGAGARPESRIQTLSLVLESLWLFYEAVHSGKPLACGDERLAQIRAALKNSPGRGDWSRERASPLRPVASRRGFRRVLLEGCNDSPWPDGHTGHSERD